MYSTAVHLGYKSSQLIFKLIEIADSVNDQIEDAGFKCNTGAHNDVGHLLMDSETQLT
jgi:hypothetical protein